MDQQRRIWKYKFLTRGPGEAIWQVTDQNENDLWMVLVQAYDKQHARWLLMHQVPSDGPRSVGVSVVRHTAGPAAGWPWSFPSTGISPYSIGG